MENLRFYIIGAFLIIGTLAIVVMYLHYKNTLLEGQNEALEARFNKMAEDIAPVSKEQFKVVPLTYQAWEDEHLDQRIALPYEVFQQVQKRRAIESIIEEAEELGALKMYRAPNTPAGRISYELLILLKNG